MWVLPTSLNPVLETLPTSVLEVCLLGDLDPVIYISNRYEPLFLASSRIPVVLYDWKEGSSKGELGPFVVEYKSPASGNHASLLCDLGLGARVSFCAFNFLMRKVG